MIGDVLNSGKFELSVEYLKAWVKDKDRVGPPLFLQNFINHSSYAKILSNSRKWILVVFLLLFVV